MQFVDEAIEVWFTGNPGVDQRPPCPAGFSWRGRRFVVAHLESGWFTLSGRRAQRIGFDSGRPPARLRGRSLVGMSRFLGRYYFRVTLASGGTADIYYDRRPPQSGASGWTLWRWVLDPPGH